MPELLLEIFSEEIPARMQARAAEELEAKVRTKLLGLGFNVGGPPVPTSVSVRTFVTPRRLALVADNLQASLRPQSEEKKGPLLSAPEPASFGFIRGFKFELAEQEKILSELRSNPVGHTVTVSNTANESVSFTTQTVSKGQTLIGRAEPTEVKTSDLIAGFLPEILANFQWPKSMRWGSGRTRWVRPVHSILALFDGAVVGIEFAGVLAGNTTRGHRFLAPKPFAVTGFADYAAKLRAAHVVLDQAERRAMIDTATQAAAAKLGLSVRPDPGLLDEVAGLVEWPVVLTGSIDDQFMGVPQEVLITAMRAHQKYFALLDGQGKLAPRFLLVSNMVTHDGGAAVVAGNERVLRARLSDARFFWDQDKKVTLDSRLPKLAGRTFFEGLGSIADKVERVRELARLLAPHTGADAALADRAAQLCKADLVTEMVGEFPELQGVMGRYYAVNDGETAAVAQAVAEHYKPQGPEDSVPSAPVSIAVALADKLDTLAGFFVIGEKPTGSKDPFALRRAGIGIIRLILDNKVRVLLWATITRAVAAYGKASNTAAKEILDFIIDRLKVYLRDQGARHDLIAAAQGRAEDDLVRLVARVGALSDFLATDDGANLLVAYRRAANILRIEEGKDGVTYAGDADAARFAAPEEKILSEAIAVTGAKSSDARSAEDFAGAMAALAGLRGPVDAFFDKVTVNADDPALRANRLKLLSGIVKAMDRVADFAKVEG